MQILYNNVTDNHWLGYGASDVHILQFTDRARVTGIKDPCDASAFRGTIDELRVLWYPKKAKTVILEERMGSVVQTLNGKTRIVIACPDNVRINGGVLKLAAGFADCVIDNIWLIGEPSNSKPNYVGNWVGYLIKMDQPSNARLPIGTRQITIEYTTTVPFGWSVD